MSVIASLRTYFLTCPALATGALLLVDHLGETPIQYALIPTAGEKVLETHVDDSSVRAMPFLFRSMESTADDLERIETAGFYETLGDWLESQTRARTLPSLGAGKLAESIAAANWGYLFEEGVSSTGIYQISCVLTYRQSA